MRSEQEVNVAIERYSDMVLRLCMVYLKTARTRRMCSNRSF